MNDDAVSVMRLVEAIKASFPDDAAWVNKRMGAQGFEKTGAPYIWVEQFSQCTTNALKSGDKIRAESHLRQISALLTKALGANDGAAVRCIDGAYVENLMSDMTDEVKRESWPLVPHNLKALYVQMWGEMPFMVSQAVRTHRQRP